jgi:signal transduction histidine kinase
MGLASTIGAPILVDGRLWGVMVASSRGDKPLPVAAESRIARFAELVSSAISNTEARVEVGRLAEEQAALRRVATLVAQGVPPSELVSAVAEEVGRLLGSDSASMVRYEDDGTVTFVADWGDPDFTLPARTNLPLGGENVTSIVFRTGRPARIDDYAKATGAVADAVGQLGTRSAVGCPVVVDGRLWGAMIAAWGKEERAPAGTESRIGEFTELIATAIANAQARSDLAASRARVVAAADQERQRVVRDLHDGAQQRVVHTIITLKLADQALHEGEDAAPELVAEALHEAETVQVELHELAHGILPTVLTQGGLRAGVEALARRTPVPVEVDVSVDRLPDPVEATAYFVVAEALTNVAKHSRAEHATVAAHLENGTLQLHVRDDGVGGAQLDGHGLVGLEDRLAALDGRLSVESPPDGGTLISAAIPLNGPRATGAAFSPST